MDIMPEPMDLIDDSDVDVPLDDWADDPFNNADDFQGAWDYDPFGPDAEIWDSLAE